jgi:Yersinia/Haemophilus virulence surface antigen
LREANPSAAAANRMDALASFDGTVHALIHQRATNASVAEDIKQDPILRASNPLYRMPLSSKPGTIKALHSKPLNEMHRLAAHVFSRSDLPLANLPAAMLEITGYAFLSVIIGPGPNPRRHAWAMHNDGQGRVSLFDSNFGEFHVLQDKLPELLTALDRQYVVVFKNRIDRVTVQPHVVDPDFTGTPAEELCRQLVAKGDNGEDAAVQGEPPSTTTVLVNSAPSTSEAAPTGPRQRVNAGNAEGV